ncbi:hypothetical protein [Burkholderia stagnalis]|uniref:hypothetical protein n=1 Tax=Burkholderia stagnalis TaxID=1503054 RepID=UPI000A81414B|nr:hypothetical protein [Burkholderia stagnalis]
MSSLPLLGNEPLLDRFALLFHGDNPYPQIVIEGHGYSRLEVRVHFSDLLGDRVLLDIAHGNFPRITDLWGTGPASATRHNQGYGTLVVNLAIQALRKMQSSTDDTCVTGLITDRRSEVADFWKKFGFSVTSPDTGKDGSLSGKLGDLVVQERAYKAGGIFDVAMDLSWFRVKENQSIAPLPRMRG